MNDYEKIVLTYSEFNDMFNHFDISDEDMMKIWYDSVSIPESSRVLLDKDDISSIIKTISAIGK